MRQVMAMRMRAHVGVRTQLCINSQLARHEVRLPFPDIHGWKPILTAKSRLSDFVAFGGLFGASVIAPVRNAGQSARFAAFGGKIPAPIHSLRN